jgi:hypothetical protein
MCRALAPQYNVTALVAFDMAVLLYMQKVGCLLGCHLKKSYSKISILKL